MIAEPGSTRRPMEWILQTGKQSLNYILHFLNKQFAYNQLNSSPVIINNHITSLFTNQF